MLCTMPEASLSQPIEEPQLSMAELRLFQDFMYRHAGVSLSDRKQALVQGRLKRRLMDLDLNSYRAYFDYLSHPQHQDEIQFCLDALTTNETFFFRHKQHWDYLLQEIVPQWRRSQPHAKRFRVWSAACSSGEEPYSLGISLYDALDHLGITVQVDASDLNSQVLERARTGRYGEYALQKLTPLCLRRYFIAQGDVHVVKPEIRRLVQFRPHNLMHASHGDSYDVIFLRNVLIYFDDDSKGVVFGHIDHRLRPGGHMFLGASESIGGSLPYRLIRPTIYRKTT